MNGQTMDRNVVKKYFYGTKWPLMLGIFGSILMLIMGMGLRGVVIVIVAAVIWSLVEKYGVKGSQEQAVDACIEADLSNFSERALTKLGLVSEQISLITPIKVLGPYYDYKEPKPGSLFSWIKAIFIRLFIHQPKLIFKYGSDDRVRYSLIQAHVFLFSESQIYVYEICYDPCNGEIFEESTAEYFYRDVDCVITGEKTERILSKRKLINKKFEYFKVIVTSGTSTHAVADGETSILATQVMAMRNLIRSKKEELSSGNSQI
ncbi:hypothetical protein ACFFSY_03510 [Paenibacillus aurantiacus]|uniref:Uncharacterized protein n=1 Tax=Paenibacillus aurantiacus TaxID=1936118 RepID=A0ABV5KIE0_9BACL